MKTTLPLWRKWRKRWGIGVLRVDLWPGRRDTMIQHINSILWTGGTDMRDRVIECIFALIVLISICSCHLMKFGYAIENKAAEPVTVVMGQKKKHISSGSIERLWNVIDEPLTFTVERRGDLFSYTIDEMPNLYMYYYKSGLYWKIGECGMRINEDMSIYGVNPKDFKQSLPQLGQFPLLPQSD